MSWESAGQYLYDHPELIAGIAAAIGLGFTGAALRHQQKQAQFKMAESIFKDLRQLEKELSDINLEEPRAQISISDPYSMDFRIRHEAWESRRKDWDSRFFNTLEWFSFLINEKEIRHQKLIDYFKPSIIEWYDNIFVKHAGQNVVNDPKQYEELKKLYQRLKKED